MEECRLNTACQSSACRECISVDCCLSGGNRVPTYALGLMWWILMTPYLHSIQDSSVIWLQVGIDLNLSIHHYASPAVVLQICLACPHCCSRPNQMPAKSKPNMCVATPKRVDGIELGFMFCIARWEPMIQEVSSGHTSVTVAHHISMLYCLPVYIIHI